jgi:hypothetical protein
MITALAISAVAIYYSVAGLVAIFAAAALPIMIMGGTLEIAKLVTAVWLHKYWRKTKWWLKAYLSSAVLILMFITSMGIFGFLSKAHIEQTASAQEGVAQLERIETELARQAAIIDRAEQKIIDAESSIGEGNATIQEQIDREQERIDNAYIRIQPAIEEQTAIIEAARAADANRTEPYEQQLTALDEELRRLDTQAIQYENRIAELTVDTSAVQPILAQIASIEESISLVQGQLAGGERAAIQAAQRTIGVDDDGAAGPNTRRAADAWIRTQQERINQLQSQVVDIRSRAQDVVDAERTRLSGLVTSIRGAQTENIKSRQLEILATIDNVRATESPVIQAARDEIARIRAGADAQIAQSDTLIQSLRESLTIGKDINVEATVTEQQNIIQIANNTIDTLTEQKYTFQAEYRKLEAEVGPVKYLAEFIYGDTADQDILEEAVRWVIVLIIFVFDPLAVLLLIASQATFEMRRQEYPRLEPAEEKINDNINRPDDGGYDWKQQYARTYTRTTSSNSDQTQSSGDEHGETESVYRNTGADNDGRVLSQRILGSAEKERRLDLTPEQQIRADFLEELEKDEITTKAKREWKQENPGMTLKDEKEKYILGKIDHLPWKGKDDVY